MTRHAPTILLFIALAVVLAACSQPGDPGAAMLKYLQARVAADRDAIRGLSCAAWEGQAVMQADSFRSMNAKLDNVTCTKSGRRRRRDAGHLRRADRHDLQRRKSHVGAWARIA